MTWAEYQIRLFALNRQKEFEKEKLNLLGSTIIASSFLEGKDKKNLIDDLQITLFGKNANAKDIEQMKSNWAEFVKNKNKR